MEQWIEDDYEQVPERTHCCGPLPPDPPTYKTKMMNPKTKPTTSSKASTLWDLTTLGGKMVHQRRKRHGRVQAMKDAGPRVAAHMTKKRWSALRQCTMRQIPPADYAPMNAPSEEPLSAAAVEGGLPRVRKKRTGFKNAHETIRPSTPWRGRRKHAAT